MASEIKVDTISEKTSANGVAIDGLTIKDGGLVGDVTFADGAYDFDIASHDTSNGLKLGGTLVTATAAELNIMDGVTTTAAEINLIDGGTARGTTALASGDGILINDAGTMRMTNVDTVKTYMATAALAGIDDQSSSNDDQLTISDTAVIINEDSDDLDFRVESNGNANMLFVDGGNDRVQIGSATSVTSGVTGDFQITKAGGNPVLSLNAFAADANPPELSFTKSRNTTVGSNTIVADDDVLGEITWYADDGGDYATEAAKIQVRVEGTPGSNDMPGQMSFYTTSDGGSTTKNRLKILPNGSIIAATVLDQEAADSDLLAGMDNGDAILGASGGGSTFARPSGGPVQLWHSSETNSLNYYVIKIYRNTSLTGSIQSNTSTVSYNTFFGTHWSQLPDNSKSDILRGTVMESIDEVCDWYMVEFTEPERELGSGIVKPAKEQRKYLPNADKTHSVGDTLTVNWKSPDDFISVGAGSGDGIDYEATVVKEIGEDYLPKSKVSDTEESTAVYGIFFEWDDGDEQNSFYVGGLGAYAVRIHQDETVAIGDYLQSKGDGTAKVQADGIFKNSTIAKVTGTTKVWIHPDGSFCVPCTLHCG